MSQAVEELASRWSLQIDADNPIQMDVVYASSMLKYLQTEQYSLKAVYRSFYTGTCPGKS
ncbi:MAG: hypothetical protein ACLVCH_08360 [Roseburia inulinivorans]